MLFHLNKLSVLKNSFKQLSRCYSSLQNVTPNSNKIFFSTPCTNSNYLDITSPLNNIPTVDSKLPTYICPSTKNLKFSINDFKITDILKRHELTLPEINKSKVIDEPLLGFQVEKQAPESAKQQKTPLHCGRSLYSEVKWRKRMMNIKKKKRYLKKLEFVINRRLQNKEKRYTDLCAMFGEIHAKRLALFEPKRYIDRELEKAKFYGYKANPVYDAYRELVSTQLKSFDEKYFRTFEDPKVPLHVKLNLDVRPKK